MEYTGTHSLGERLTTGGFAQSRVETKRLGDGKVG